MNMFFDIIVNVLLFGDINWLLWIVVYVFYIFWIKMLGLCYRYMMLLFFLKSIIFYLGIGCLLMRKIYDVRFLWIVLILSMFFIDKRKYFILFIGLNVLYLKF